jgi:multiple antibiotic resistance protein
MHWSEYTRFFISLFILLAPFFQVPFMLSLAEGADRQVILRTATIASATALAILLSAHYVGEAILTSLGTSLPSFQIGGGLIVLLIGLSLVQGKPLEPEVARGDRDSTLPLRIGVTPLGTPAIAGAGTITAVILETHEEHGLVDDLMITLIIIVNIAIVWGILASAPTIGAFLGRNGLLVIQRIVGLLVVAIGVEIVVSGFNGHFATLT